MQSFEDSYDAGHFVDASAATAERLPKQCCDSNALKKELHIQDMQASVYKYANPTLKSATTFNRSGIKKTSNHLPTMRS